jgi:peptidoglycan/LPS O-acetylase OafA/YrhL
VPASSHAEFLARRSFGSLDGIRCLSIVAVVWHHTVVGVDWLPATKRGYLGVDMFFVVSGFLIVALLLRERDRSGEISLRKFHVRRALRIFPSYYGVLLVLAVTLGVFRRDGALAGPFFAELPYYLTYTSNWVELHTLLAISWSLAAEAQFYLVWPPIEKYAARVTIPILLAVIAANQLVNFRVLRVERDLPMLQATFTPICLGVGLAHLLHSPAGFRGASRALSARWASPLALAVLVALCSIPNSDISGWHRLLTQLAMSVFLCACVAREDHGLQGVLCLPAIARIGVISYGVYLYHQFGRGAAEVLLQRAGVDVPLALFATCLALTIAVAELSFRYYETPFLRMKEWLDSRGSLRRGAARQ